VLSHNAQPCMTVIGRMEDLKRFAGDDTIDTWWRSGRMPGPGEPDVSLAENRAWLMERVERGDSFGIATDPGTLPAVVGGRIPGIGNGYYTAWELAELRKLGIEPAPMFGSGELGSSGSGSGVGKF
jgi:hypothetical protein